MSQIIIAQIITSSYHLSRLFIINLVSCSNLLLLADNGSIVIISFILPHFEAVNSAKLMIVVEEVGYCLICSYLLM